MITTAQKMSKKCRIFSIGIPIRRFLLRHWQNFMHVMKSSILSRMEMEELDSRKNRNIISINATPFLHRKNQQQNV